MARTILPLAGAFVGSFFGAPQLGFAIGSVIGNAVDPQRIKGPRIGDANVQTSQEGTPRPIVYGTAAVMGNLIDRGPLNKVITEERQGKGGGPVVENESLFMTFAIRICEGPIGGVLRIWEDERLVYDVRPESEIVQDSARYAQGFTLYLGDEDQLPDPDLESIHGAGNTPAHRGSAYIVFKEKNLTERRGSIPQFRFEVSRCAADVPIIIEGYWVGFGFNNVGGAICVVSPDGINWNNPGAAIGGTFIQGVTSAGGDLLTLIACQDDTDARISLDGGLTWGSITLAAIPSTSNREIDVYGNRFFISTSSSGMNISDNGGLTWSLVTLDNAAQASVFSRKELGGAIYGTRGADKISISTNNGDSWAETGNSIGFTVSGFMAQADRIAVLPTAGDRNRVAVSDDFGGSWTTYTMPISTTASIRSQCSIGANGRWIVVNELGEIAYSENATSWGLSTFTFPSTPRAIAFGEGRFVIVGNDGKIAYSNDGGVNWTETSSTQFDTRDITFVYHIIGGSLS